MGPIALLLLSFVLISCCFGASWLGSAAHLRSLTRRILELEYSFEDLNGRVMREVKIRAGTAGMEAKKKDQALMDWAEREVGNAGTEGKEPDLQSWIKKGFTR